MNYDEEQRNELEALSEIYYNEIKILSSEPPISFSINVRPQAANYEESEQNNSDGEANENSDSDSFDEDSTHNGTSQQTLSVELLFNLPPKYPDEIPSVQILDSQNLDEGELSELLDNLSRTANESLGTVMVFTLVSDVVEWLSSKTEREVVELEQEKDKKLKEIEEKRFEGTPVTEQTFLAWKLRFDAEMLKAKLTQQRLQSDQTGSSRRLTGREMFETDKTLVESDLNFVEDLDQGQIEALLHNIEEIDLVDDEVNDMLDKEEADFSDDDDDDDDFELEQSSEEEEIDEKKPGTHKSNSKR